MGKPNFALLIGKKLEEKDKGEPLPTELPASETDSEGAEGVQSESSAMQDSAIADLLAALKADDVQGAKNALKDFLELAKEPDGDEA